MDLTSVCDSLQKFRRKKLKQIFEQLDRNNDGKISAEELMHAFDAAGLKYDKVWR